MAVDSAGLPCFVGMPHTKRAEKLWAGLVETAIRDAGMRPDWADHSSETGSVTEDMLHRIRLASVVCGLLSDERYTYGRGPSVNPNVFYEIGYAHAHNKPTVLVVDHPDQVPFDLRHHRHVVIGRTTTPADHARLVDILRASRDLSPGGRGSRASGSGNGASDSVR